MMITGGRRTEDCREEAGRKKMLPTFSMIFLKRANRTTQIPDADSVNN